MAIGKKAPTPQELAAMQQEEMYRRGVTTLRDIIAPSSFEVQSNYVFA